MPSMPLNSTWDPVEDVLSTLDRIALDTRGENSHDGSSWNRQMEQDLLSMRSMLGDVMQCTHQLQTRLQNVERSLHQDESFWHKLFSQHPAFSSWKAQVKDELVELFRGAFGKELPGHEKSDHSLGTETIADEYNPQYSFEESIWDLGMFVGSQKLGSWGSSFVGLLLIANVMMQIIFISICQLNLTTNRYDDLARDGLKEFRATYAHDPNYAHVPSASTLAQQICSQEVDDRFKYNSMFWGTSQLATLSAIRSYLSADGSWATHFFNGRLLCGLALLCWILTIVKDFHNTFLLSLGVLKLPRGSTTDIDHSGDEYTLRTIGRMRFFFVVGILFLRFSCAGFLLYSGAKWLAYTSEASELILNAAALEFVLNIDELLYLSLAPQAGKFFLENLRPISTKGFLYHRGLDIFAGLGALLVAALLFCLVFFVVDPQVKEMEQADEILCGADLTLMATRDYHLGMLWFDSFENLIKSQSDIDLVTAERAFANTQMYTNMKIHGGSPRLGATASQWKLNVLQIPDMDFNRFMELLNPTCGNDLNNGTFLHLVQDILSDASIHSCEDVVKYCLIDNLEIIDSFKWLRVICPDACGCMSPVSMVPSHWPDSGCPASCIHKAAYTRRLEELTCSDMNATTLSQTAFWPLWGEYLHQKLNHFEPGGEGNITAAMLSIGCESLWLFPRETRFQLCGGDSIFLQLRPWSPICPEQCDCRRGAFPTCSAQCVVEYEQGVGPNLEPNGTWLEWRSKFWSQGILPPAPSG